MSLDSELAVTGRRAGDVRPERKAPEVSKVPVIDTETPDDSRPGVRCPMSVPQNLKLCSARSCSPMSYPACIYFRILKSSYLTPTISRSASTVLHAFQPSSSTRHLMTPQYRRTTVTANNGCSALLRLARHQPFSPKPPIMDAVAARLLHRWPRRLRMP